MCVIVTGAASGIGRATAERLSNRWPVICADQNLAGACETAARIAASGQRAHALEVDVTDPVAVEAMVEASEATFGPVEALFSNAGINRRNPVDSIAEPDWDAMMATHVTGALLTCQGVLRRMVPRGRGAIVCTSSDFAVMGVAGNAAYTAAKSAIYSLVKSMAVEFTPRGIRVNAVGPGPIDTPMLRSGRTAEQFAAVEQKFATVLPMGRLGRPEEVAFVVDFLLSARASFISGQLVHPNGGQLMW